MGLQALRDFFMKIHPEWTNQPSDAAALEKGLMILDNNEQLLDFNKGDITQWNFSLITTVLLFSKRCAIEIKKKSGRKNALEMLKMFRNKWLGHPCTDKMSNKDFNTFWGKSRRHFVALGADPSKIDEIKSQSGTGLINVITSLLQNKTIEFMFRGINWFGPDSDSP